MGKDEETEIAVECSVLVFVFSFDVGRVEIRRAQSSNAGITVDFPQTPRCTQLLRVGRYPYTLLDPRFRKPPYDPGRSDFPSPVLTLALFPPTAFHILDEA